MKKFAYSVIIVLSSLSSSFAQNEKKPEFLAVIHSKPSTPELRVLTWEPQPVSTIVSTLMASICLRLNISRSDLALPGISRPISTTDQIRLARRPEQPNFRSITLRAGRRFDFPTRAASRRLRRASQAWRAGTSRKQLPARPLVLRTTKQASR